MLGTARQGQHRVWRMEWDLAVYKLLEAERCNADAENEKEQYPQLTYFPTAKVQATRFKTVNTEVSILEISRDGCDTVSSAREAEKHLQFGGDRAFNTLPRARSAYELQRTFCNIEGEGDVADGKRNYGQTHGIGR